MLESDRLPLLLSRRNKRLKYFREQLSSAPAAGEQRGEIEALLVNYALLISKLAKASSDLDRDDAEFRLQSVERQLTSRFEAKRLLTSR